MKGNGEKAALGADGQPGTGAGGTPPPPDAPLAGENAASPPDATRAAAGKGRLRWDEVWYQAPPPREGFGSELRQLFRFICATNPFYLVSAALFLFGEAVLFNTKDIWIDTAIPFGLMAAYAALLAGAAVLIVRLGQVWDDARSILLLVVFLLLALSVGLDTKILENPDWALAMLAGGWVFAVLLSEALCRGLRLRVPPLLRGVYSAVLGVFFLYPYVLALLVNGEDREAGILGLGLFPAVAGVAFLGLLPAVRRGPEYVRDNGSPWRWPWYPWMVFVVLAVGVCVRTYLMCVSFFPGDGFGSYRGMTTGFGPYMLIPFAVALLVLFLEHGLAVKSVPWQLVSFAAIPILYGLAVPSLWSHSGLHREFMRVLLGAHGHPLLLAAASAVVFCAYAWLRRAQGAGFALAIAVAAGLLVGHGTGALRDSGVSPAILLLGAAVVLAWFAYCRRVSGWAFLSLVCVVAGLALQFRGTWFTDFRGTVPLHLLYVGVLLIGAAYKDGFARVLQNLAALVLPSLFATALFGHRWLTPTVPDWAVVLYLSALMVVSALGFILLANDVFLYVGLINAVLGVVYLVARGHQATAHAPVQGTSLFFWAGVSFLVALAISLWKGGILQRCSAGTSDALYHTRARVHRDILKKQGPQP